MMPDPRRELAPTEVAGGGRENSPPGEERRAPHTRRLIRIRNFLFRVLSKADEDNIFFMAGAITFNVLIAFVPLLLLIVGVSGFVLSARFGDPAGVILAFLLQVLPTAGDASELEASVRGVVDPLLAEREGFTLLGALVFVWISTRLVGTLRTVLREIFDVGQDRGIVRGKLFDAQIVVIAGILAVVNLGITVVLGIVRDFGVSLVGLEGESLRLTQSLFGQGVALGSIWVMFVLIYRYLPTRRIPWRTVLIAATFTGVLFEVMKLAFSWYVVSAADYRTAYGNLATIAILFFWIYYGAVVFILGGEVAQVYTMRRARRLGTGKMLSGSTSRMATVLLAIGGIVLGSRPLAAQHFTGDDGIQFSARVVERGIVLENPLVRNGGRYIIVHLAENRVYVVDGAETIWSAPAGTGTGFRLAGQGKRWRFTTPKGLFKVRRMEKDPMWEAPDWYYVEKGLRIPPLDHPSRRIRGAMGTTALYLGDGIAIHGTNSPAILMNPDPDRRRISHGCIRLTNESARELYHLVEVGTPVLVY
jgi:membrane protein